jgi:hypothetical protein
LYVGGVLLATDTLAPWSFSWDTTKKANGTYAVNARAYDAAGHVTASPYVNITVSNGTTTPTADTTAPVAHILSPVHASTIGASVNINVSATDNVAVTSISVYVDGALIATGSTGSLAYTWDASHMTIGWHKITATAKDKAGNAGSTTIAVYY